MGHRPPKLLTPTGTVQNCVRQAAALRWDLSMEVGAFCLFDIQQRTSYNIVSRKMI